MVRDGVLEAVEAEPERDRAAARAGERAGGRAAGDVHRDDHSAVKPGGWATVNGRLATGSPPILSFHS